MAEKKTILQKLNLHATITFVYMIRIIRIYYAFWHDYNILHTMMSCSCWCYIFSNFKSAELGIIQQKNLFIYLTQTCHSSYFYAINAHKISKKNFYSKIIKIRRGYVCIANDKSFLSNEIWSFMRWISFLIPNYQQKSHRHELRNVTNSIPRLMSPNPVPLLKLCYEFGQFMK